MMDQYFEIKEAHPDTVLFFRMGDFYEMFYGDAEIVSKELGLTLTSRDKKADKPIPMAGFPWHALEDNLKKMVTRGYKITLCEQEQELIWNPSRIKNLSLNRCIYGSKIGIVSQI